MLEPSRIALQAVWWSVFLLCAGDFHALRAAGEIGLDLEATPGQPTLANVIIKGLPAEVIKELRGWDRRDTRWGAWLAMYVGESALPSADRPAMLGDYETEGQLVRFRPRFPFKAGLDYLARFDGEKLRALLGGSVPPMPLLESEFRVPEPAPDTSTRVLAVYPSSQSVPENLLRMYVHFSAPMQAKNVHRYIRLVDAAGVGIELPFVEVEHGLWDAKRQRLTLFFHPGRIKRGVGPNLAMGPPLRRGESFRLVIDRAFLDVNGFPLQQTYEKVLEVGEADRSSPNPADWLVAPPGSAASSLVIEFPEPLDQALLGRLLRVEDSVGELVAGSIEIDRQETRWSFRPLNPWPAGGYSVWVDPALEDLAGNRIDGLFEITESTSPDSKASRPVEIAFWLDF